MKRDGKRAASATKKGDSAVQKWERLGKQWHINFPLDDNHPELGSWLDPKFDNAEQGSWGASAANLPGSMR